MEEVQAQVEVAGLSSAIRDDKVIEGKNGRLFLANDSNDVFRQHAGELCLTEEQLEAWEALLERRRSALANRGSQYLFAIAPDAHSVYPDELPDWVVTAARRPVHQLMDRAGLPVPLVYPLEDLVAERANWPVYPRTSSHWDDFGGFLAYRRLCRAVVDLPVRELSPTEIAFGELVLSLDLGVKMTPPRASSHVEAFVLDRTARLVLDNCVENTGSMIVTECLAAPPSRCIMFGDSYAEALLKFLAESFRRFVFAHSPTVDLELVERERPNLVVSLMAERFLIQVPDDAGAPSLVERERAKRKAGAARRKIAFWAGRFPSLWAIERTRADLIGDGRFKDATIVSVLAYAGLRPAEVQSLRWGDVGGHEIHVGVGASAGRASDLGPERRVRLMAPVAEDLARWRQAQGDPTADEHVFPGPSGIWKKGEWLGWHEQVFRPVAERYGLMDTRPYDLHNTFCSLLIHEGMSPAEVGQQAGYPASTMSEVYEHRFLVAENSVAVPAEDRIMARRSEVADGWS